MNQKRAGHDWAISEAEITDARASYLQSRRAAERRADRKMIASLLLDSELLAAADRNDDLFCELMKDAFDRGQVSRTKLATAINASGTQVGRWANKGSAAPVYARRMILWSAARLILEEEGMDAPPFPAPPPPVKPDAPKGKVAKEEEAKAGGDGD